jgi:hypothetical protein
MIVPVALVQDHVKYTTRFFFHLQRVSANVKISHHSSLDDVQIFACFGKNQIPTKWDAAAEKWKLQQEIPNSWHEYFRFIRRFVEK